MSARAGSSLHPYRERRPPMLELRQLWIFTLPRVSRGGWGLTCEDAVVVIVS
jgi:hypothetical protein